ncbi:Peptidoglycan O-acetyltransferase [compost metagenome]
MLFNSFSFLLFFPIVTALYFATPHRFRWLTLLLASCVFYMAFIPAYILILAFTIVVDYFAGLAIAQAQGRRRLQLLWVSIAANLGILGFFKYFNFFNDNLRGLAEAIHWNYPVAALAIILPIGLSFHIFQSLSYTIEVYRGQQAPERHFGIYALYVMFYPQLVAGPIERPQNLLHQFHARHDFDYDRVTDGLKFMLWGLFMKIMVADRLALIVNPVFERPSDFTGVTLWVACLAFSFQIFCDFAGYSIIAIGAARVMGFTLMQNFNQPYRSRSIREFWTRWHISLSTWFRDYLYIPLGGSRVSKGRWCLNMAIVFLVSGLWHGANWTFIVWGGLHALYAVGEILTGDLRKRLSDGALGSVVPPPIQSAWQITTTFMLVTFAWIFFRAESLPDALYIVTHLFQGLGDQLSSSAAFWNAVQGPQLTPTNLIIGVAAVLALEAVHASQRHGGVRARLAAQPVWVRWAAYQTALLVMLMLGVYESHAFIYFQF